MKKKNWLVMSLFISSMAFAVSSCSDDNNNDNTVDDSAMDPVKTALINDYIDLTVLPTYDDMKAKVWDLMDAVTVMFESETATQDQLNAVCAAWRNAREPWELSEGFLYGPAANYSIDPSLDSWPLDQVNIEALLNSSQNIAEQTFAQDNSGFHTLEYLIFLNGNPRDISSISSRQKEYIYYVTKKLLDDTVRLWAEWHGEKAISDQRDAELIENDEITIAGGEDGFAELLRNPNMYQKYKTQNQVLEEIIDNGLCNIANEVGTQKIGNPYRELDLYAVESWYSWHSREDYRNNIYSIRNAYYGTLDGTVADNSISKIIEGSNSTLNNNVKQAINKAATAIWGIPQPFRNNINSSEAEEAMEACSDLETVLKELNSYIGSTASINSDAILQPVVKTYVEVVVLPTYASLKSKVDALYDAVIALSNSPSNTAFETACDAWLQARQPWEVSEAFLFGPVASLGLDPNMDSWPLDQNAIVQLLNSGDWDQLNWSGDYDEDNEGIAAAQNVRGFHTLEFLLFKDGQARKVK